MTRVKSDKTSFLKHRTHRTKKKRLFTTNPRFRKLKVKFEDDSPSTLTEV